MASLADEIIYEIRASILDVIIGSLFFRDADDFSDSGSDSDDDATESVARKAEKKVCERRNSLTFFVTQNGTRLSFGMQPASS